MKHSRSNPATRVRRLRSVLELRVRFRPTYSAWALSSGTPEASPLIIAAISVFPIDDLPLRRTAIER
jgi:hypothetical protein